MPRIIPFKDYSAFVEKVVLDGIPYQLRFWWNTTGEYWTMQMLNLSGTVLLSGIKIVLGIELISSFAWMGLPPGELYAVDTTGELDQIGEDDLSDGAVFLRYIPEDEL